MHKTALTTTHTPCSVWLDPTGVEPQVQPPHGHFVTRVDRVAPANRAISVCLLAFLVASLSVLASPLRATTLFTNVSSASPLGAGAIEGTSEGQFLADAFAFVPTTTASFTDALIDLWTLSGNDGNVSGFLYSNSASTGNTPGTQLAQLSSLTAPSYASLPALAFSANHFTFTQIGGPAITLTAGTEYWLVLSPTDATSFLYYAYGNGALFNIPEAQQFPTINSAWTAASSANVELQIDGTPTSSSTTPEPASLILLASGLAAIYAAHLIRRNSRA